jgi:hypothetical protein
MSLPAGTRRIAQQSDKRKPAICQILNSLNSGRCPVGSAGPFDARQMTMGAVYRRAMRKDANRLYDIRRRSIIELAHPTMTAAEAQVWAAKLTPSGMERKLRELEVWVGERGGIVAGWGPFARIAWRACIRRRNLPGRA